MPKITKTQAKMFLENASPEDKIAIVHHDDGDGFCAGIIIYDFLITKNITAKTFSYSLSKTSLEELPLDSFNKIIIIDISTKVIQEEIKYLKKSQVLVLDHHPASPLPEEVFSFITFEQGYIPSSRTAYELTKQKKWLALIGTLSDSADLYKENNEFIKKALEELNTTLDDFKTNYSHPLSNTIMYFSDTPEKIFPILSKINSLQEIKELEKYSKEIEEEIQEQVKKYQNNKEKIGNVNFCIIDPKYPTKGVVIAILSKQNPEEIFILLSSKKSNKNILGISARHNSSNANLPELLEKITKGLKNSRTGGHLRASGGQIQLQDLEEFKQNIKNYATK